MNEPQAREILGVSETASFKEIKSAYRRLLIMVHPDKVNQSSDAQEQAQRVTSRINEAWNYLEEREKNGTLGDLTNESSTQTASQERMPYSHECNFCGFAPAIRTSGAYVNSFLIWTKRGKYDVNTCKYCGIAMARFALRESLLIGWWGFGLISMPQVIINYVKNMRLLKSLRDPEYRDPNVFTLGRYPMPIPPSPFKEPSPMLATALAIILLFSWLNAVAKPVPSTSTVSDYFGKQGTCYEEVTNENGQQVQMVNCSNSSASLKSVLEVSNATYCPSTSTFTTTGKNEQGVEFIACLDRI